MKKVVEVWYETENGFRVIRTGDVIRTVNKLLQKGYDVDGISIVEEVENGYIHYQHIPLENGWKGTHVALHPFRIPQTTINAEGRAWYFENLEEVAKFIEED